MIKANKGSIISIGSDAGRVGEFQEAVYSASKAGVIAFSKVCASLTCVPFSRCELALP